MGQTPGTGTSFLCKGSSELLVLWPPLQLLCLFGREIEAPGGELHVHVEGEMGALDCS